MIITILAYKPNGVETRRCCVVDQWDSDFETFTTVDPQAAANWLAQFLYDGPNAQKGTYECTVLINGVDDNTWLDGEPEEDYDARQALIAQVTDEAAVALAKLVEEEKAAKARREAARVAGLASAAKARKVAELEQLRGRLSADTIEADRARLRALEADLEGNP
jgi:hypothetical protein